MSTKWKVKCGANVDAKIKEKLDAKLGTKWEAKCCANVEEKLDVKLDAIVEAKCHVLVDIIVDTKVEIFLPLDAKLSAISSAKPGAKLKTKLGAKRAQFLALN